MASSPKTKLLILSLASALPMVVSAQSTTGSIFGQAPNVDNGVIVVESQSGLRRELSVNKDGRYQSPQLPVGTYRVSLTSNGRVIDERDNVTLTVGSTTEVSFSTQASGVQNLQGVTVTGANLAAIDVSSVDSRTVITLSQLNRLPLARSSEAIALLAPGVVANSGRFTSGTGNSLVSFGGSSASENAYYINGFNTTDPLRGLGGLTLPYGAIAQQETYTGGYSAKYGRSDGGVINAVGRTGTNEWHFGGHVLWEPAFLRSSPDNVYYTNGLPPNPVAGRLFSPKSGESYWNSTVSAYGGGPLIKDKLFLFAAMEFERTTGNAIGDVQKATTSYPYLDYRYGEPRWYAKLDWNINDNNILELTGASDKFRTKGEVYNYDYNTLARGTHITGADNTKNGGDLWVAKYTSYITDNLNLSVMYGKMHTRNYDSPSGYDPSVVYISSPNDQNPALNGGTPITNAQTVSRIYDPDRGNKTNNFRFDLNYTLGNHSLAVGIDNQNARSINQGYRPTGPDGFLWSYGHANPNVPVSTGLGVPATIGFPNGQDGYYVTRNIDSQLATIHSNQRAQYIEDRWQVTNDLLVSLGLRNDQFTNYNAHSQAFINQRKPQWAPRLGASWNVHGDSSLKIYGNAGRYYLGLPLQPSINSAGANIQTREYFTYSGISSDGSPTGLTSMAPMAAINNQFGQLPDPRTVTSKGLVAEYQDEFIAGVSGTFQQDWVYGVKLTERILRNAIDDYCDYDVVVNEAKQLGYDINLTNSCYLINPGKGNTFVLQDAAGAYVDVPMKFSQFGWQKLKRKYYSAEFTLEHPFKDRWYGRVSYVFSRSYGNTEGQLRSDISQSFTSTTQDWDYASIMLNTNGVLNNDHPHQFKAYGYFQATPEILVSGTLSLVSGAPKVCLGYLGAELADPAAYGNVYHFCNGKPSPPGSHGRMPWLRQLDLGLTYRPAFAQQRLAFAANVFNVLNAQAETNIYVRSNTDPGVPNPRLWQPLSTQQPRFVRFSVSYDY